MTSRFEFWRRANQSTRYISVSFQSYIFFVNKFGRKEKKKKKQFKGSDFESEYMYVKSVQEGHCILRNIEETDLLELALTKLYDVVTLTLNNCNWSVNRLNVNSVCR